MDINFIIKDLENTLSEKRFLHSIGTMKFSEKLAKIYDEDIEKAKLAAILHDCAKEINDEKMLKYVNDFKLKEIFGYSEDVNIYHGAVGAIVVKDKYNIFDEYILSAITWHTTGKDNMSLLDKIVFVADLVEENTRDYHDVDFYRNLALEDIDKTIILACDFVIEKLIKKNKSININMVKARNYLIFEKKGVNIK